mmetsp:Transcript_8987/g.12208  ORF Transcript_8987/g.12208 Transcript_8987/m.12208 type:complete len:134 (-) Transcript_8987:34-435(-)
MEMGILHYFADLHPLLGKNGIVPRLLKPGGKLILRDFHPVSTKLLVSQGRKRTFQGNYFSPALHSSSLSCHKFSLDQGNPVPEILHRRWTLGEVLTTIAEGGLCLKVLQEEPGVRGVDTRIPKVFTLVAQQLY